MNDRVIFMLDNDKDFLELYSKLLQSKGCQVFATDNLFLLLKYAQTALPQWIFIDENFAPEHETEIIGIINKNIPENQTHFAVMGSKISSKNLLAENAVEFVYKPRIIEKMMQITENSCNTH